jgi:hypothetical protein
MTRALVVLLAVVLALPAAPVGPAAAQSDANPCVGTVTAEPDRTTLFSIQGARGGDKTDAMLVGVRPDGSVVGVHNGADRGKWWYYDVDPLANGNLLLSTTEPGVSIVEELDADTGRQVASRQLPSVFDSHDADLLDDGELLANDMSQDGDDRVVVYDLDRETVVWEYRFANHTDAFPENGGGEFGGDWTHNNDVEAIGDDVYMVSVRNFDTVAAIDRETKELVWRLGEDDNHTVLNEQHNPDYLGADPGPTVLVADSLNDRVVEYTREDGVWNRTWTLRGGGLDEPRDADRLPNGNTLVADRRGHRILEVTPAGEVVWEFYAPWQPYDVERLGTGDESAGGPTSLETGTTGTVELTGSAGYGESRIESCYDFLVGVDAEGVVPASETPTPAPSATTSPDDTAATATPVPESALGSGPSPALGVGLAAALLALVVLVVRRGG